MLTKELPTEAPVHPAFIEPMQVSPVRDLPDGGAWTYEAKLDGYRCLAAGRSGGVVLWSRRGNGFTARFPAIARACEKLPADTLIDGEVIAVDGNGKVSFNALQYTRPKAHLQFYAFDILVHRGRNALRLPIEERRRMLTEALRKVNIQRFNPCRSTLSPRTSSGLLRNYIKPDDREFAILHSLSQIKGAFYSSL